MQGYIKKIGGRTRSLFISGFNIDPFWCLIEGDERTI